jgi:predicted DNA-binding protein (UPF0251 family)
MSPRPKKHRSLEQPPIASGFIPAGGDFVESQAVVLNMEEYEAIRLSDYLNLTQLEASRLLNVSRPTYTRIYDAARKKVARAFVENLGLLIRGGQVVFHDRWFACGDCESVFKLKTEQPAESVACPVCQSSSVEAFSESPGDTFARYRQPMKSSGSGLGQSGNCICPGCDLTVPHIAGIPCSTQLCPQCNIRMIREHSEHHLNIKRKKSTVSKHK